jgi:RHH-type proline utilization regulon transcriptional repressor/proline dehydrogenase/delta 1-pyrroline-5-carboxylate dehydrogenase
VGTVILTGAWETARSFQGWRPGLRLLAETSGKNAMVVTATADVDQAVADVARSAFGHAGQKCSAASLAIVDASVYDGSAFLRQLADAVRSLRVGPASSPPTEVGPLVGPMTDALHRALTVLDAGESWLVAPRCIDEQARLWSPGVRCGVAPGSWAHRTEWFGPVLGVMRSTSLDEAIRWQNSVAYGLTAGLQSTDPAEQERWSDAVEAGNLYINRTTTGAIVGRQPFGGWKRSAWGPTAKAGGPGYLGALSRWRDAPSPGETSAAPVALGRVEASYRRWWDANGISPTEMAGLASEANELSYHPLPGVIVRAGTGVDGSQVARALLAARVTGTPVEVSTAEASMPAPGASPVRIETGAELARRLRPGGSRLRVLGEAEPEVLAAAASAGVAVLNEAVLACGGVELPRWLREKVVSRSRHRYGNIVA